MSTTGDITSLTRDSSLDGKSDSIPTLSNEAGATASTLSDNTWGYRLNNTGNFIPYVSGVQIMEKSIATNADTATLSFASKINYNKSAGSYAINLIFTGVSNPSTNYLYDTIASMSKGTQTVADLQAEITIPTSDDYTTDTSNSGVYEYDATTFGAATDASNDYKIYYYRGVLENSVGSYGSDGSAVTYPNYVRLGGNSTTSTCWRILRTTGSGGVKMIYNGLWTGSTCANATTKAQHSFTGSAFDTSADSSSGQSIVGVGYMYNASYKSTTTSTQAGTLFGTNSSFAGNTTKSTIKGKIDTWYTSNLSTTYGSHLESSAGFCGDRSVNSGSSWTTYSDTTSITTPYRSGSSGSDATWFYFGSNRRNYSTAQTPSLGCPRSTVDLYTTSSASNGNKKLTNPIALITADEASFAGSGSSTATKGSSYHTNSFLRSGAGFWLLSPSDRDSSATACVSYLGATGFLSRNNVTVAHGVRPAISLAQGTQISSGSGTATDPWEVTW